METFTGEAKHTWQGPVLNRLATGKIIFPLFSICSHRIIKNKPGRPLKGHLACLPAPKQIKPFLVELLSKLFLKEASSGDDGSQEKQVLIPFTAIIAGWVYGFFFYPPENKE